MKTLQDEATDIALGIGKALCRNHDVTPDEWNDCVQEGVAAALKALPHWKGGALLSTFLYWRVRGAIMDYRAKQQNGGTGGRDARVGLVSLQDEVIGVQDFDGEPMTYEDIMSYDEPPHGLGDPLDELLRVEEEARTPGEPLAEQLLQTLSSADRALIMRYFGISSPEATQAELALTEGITQQSVSERIQRIIKRLSESAKKLGCEF